MFTWVNTLTLDANEAITAGIWDERTSKFLCLGKQSNTSKPISIMSPSGDGWSKVVGNTPLDTGTIINSVVSLFNGNSIPPVKYCAVGSNTTYNRPVLIKSDNGTSWEGVSVTVPTFFDGGVITGGLNSIEEEYYSNSYGGGFITAGNAANNKYPANPEVLRWHGQYNTWSPSYSRNLQNAGKANIIKRVGDSMYIGTDSGGLYGGGMMSPHTWSVSQGYSFNFSIHTICTKKPYGKTLVVAGGGGYTACATDGANFNTAVKAPTSGTIIDMVYTLDKFVGLAVKQKINNRYALDIITSTDGRNWEVEQLAVSSTIDKPKLIYSRSNKALILILGDSIYTASSELQDKQPIPTKPIVTELTARSLKLTSIEGSIVVLNNEHKESGSTFSFLIPNTTYTAYSYMPASDTLLQSDNSQTETTKTKALSNEDKTMILSGVMIDGSRAPQNILDGVILSTSNDNVVISDNRILAVKPGTTTITYTKDGKITQTEITIV